MLRTSMTTLPFLLLGLSPFVIFDSDLYLLLGLSPFVIFDSDYALISCLLCKLNPL